MSLHGESIPNRNSRTAIMLRESRREGGKIARCTLFNPTRLPPCRVEAIRLVRKRGRVVADPREAPVIRRARSHGAASVTNRISSREKFGVDFLGVTGICLPASRSPGIRRRIVLAINRRLPFIRTVGELIALIHKRLESSPCRPPSSPPVVACASGNGPGYRCRSTDFVVDAGTVRNVVL